MEKYHYEQGVGILIPLYDPKKNLLFLGKKTDNTILNMSVSASNDSLKLLSEYKG